MTKISAMPLDSAPTLTDSIPTLDAETITTKRNTLQNLLTLFFNNVPNSTIKTPALALSTALDGTNGVKTQANSGSAGGNFSYINLGGIKLLWGSTPSMLAGAGSVSSKVVTYPTSFFTTFTTIVAMINANADGRNTVYVTGETASSATLNVQNQSGATGGANAVYYLVIGT